MGVGPTRPDPSGAYGEPAGTPRGSLCPGGDSISVGETLLSGHGRWGDWAGDGDPGWQWGDWAGDGDPGWQSLEPSLDEWAGKDHPSEGMGRLMGAKGHFSL